MTIEITKFVKPEITTPEGAFSYLMKALSAQLSDRNITPTNLITAVVAVKNFSKALKAMEDVAAKNLKELVLTTGNLKEGTSQIFLQVGEYSVEARVANTKLDVVKVESMLRAKNLSIDSGMDKEISYKVNESKLADLVIRKKITSDELEACRHEVKYNLQTPKKVNDTDELSP